MPRQEPIGVYGYGDVAPYLKPFPQLTANQCRSLMELSANLPGGAKVDILQTFHTSGGTHLYVRHPKDGDFHIAADGNIASLGGQFDA